MQGLAEWVKVSARLGSQYEVHAIGEIDACKFIDYSCFGFRNFFV